jgi:hypothetical protein
VAAMREDLAKAQRHYEHRNARIAIGLWRSNARRRIVHRKRNVSCKKSCLFASKRSTRVTIPRRRTAPATSCSSTSRLGLGVIGGPASAFAWTAG